MTAIGQEGARGWTAGGAIGGAAGRLRLFVRELRAEFLPASALPVFVGAALAFYRTGRWDGWLFLWCLAGVAALHAGANVLNDYFDHRTGNDAINTDFVRPFTGGSRLIQQGLLDPREVLGLGVGLVAVGAGVGACLAIRLGPGVLAFLLPGAAAGIAYSLPRVGLAAQGLGEAAVAAAFGVLPVWGSYYAQMGAWDAEPFFLSLPLAVLIAAVLLINEFQDCRADGAVGKRTWVVRMGPRRAVRAYTVLMALWPCLLLVAAAAGAIPGFLAWVALLGALGVPAGRCAWRCWDRPARLAPANALTIAAHTAVSLALGASLLAARAFAQ